MPEHQKNESNACWKVGWLNISGALNFYLIMLANFLRYRTGQFYGHEIPELSLALFLSKHLSFLVFTLLA